MPENKAVMEDLQMKHRPRLWKHVLGQDSVVKMIRSKLEIGKLPHAMLLTGPSGTGKTTIARVLREKLGLGNESKPNGDYEEVNVAESRGIDKIRDIISRMKLGALNGKSRMWVFDECHRWTPDAQSAALKMLEDMSSQVYFILATTDSGKLLKTIHTRCTEYKLKLLDEKTLKLILKDVAKKEGWEPSEAVLDKIADVADGSARKALVVMGQVMELTTEEDRLEAVQKSETKKQARELTQLLMDGAKWKQIAAVLKDVEDEPESLRCMILGYATALMLNGAKMKQASIIVEAFEGSWFQSGVGGKAQLMSRCWSLSEGK